MSGGKGLSDIEIKFQILLSNDETPIFTIINLLFRDKKGKDRYIEMIELYRLQRI